MTVLAADVGGTKTLVGLFESDGRELLVRRFETSSFRSILAMLETFLALDDAKAHAAPTSVAVGVAGPVERFEDGHASATLTNYRVSIDSRALEQALHVERAVVLNDFETIAIAVARSIDHPALSARLAPVSLTKGLAPHPPGTLAVIGAGTGLGHAIVLSEPAPRRILPSEGGHADVSANDELGYEIVRVLRSKLGEHVSVERLVSGPGLVTLYSTLADLGAEKPSAEVDAAIEKDRRHAPAIISQHALAGDDPLSVLALERFVQFYGAHAGNFALTVLATGGVYLAGGIAPRILPFLEKGFLPAFVAKGRFSPLLAAVPVHVVTNPSVGLIGAAIEAGRLS